MSAPDRLRDELIVRHLAWARKIALRYRGRGVELEDLVAEARVGLCEAAERYDVETHPGVSFAGYALGWIRSRISGAFERSSCVRLPRALQRAAGRIREAEAALMAAGDHQPTPAEIAEATGLDVETCRSVLAFGPGETPVESYGLVPEFEDPDQQRLLKTVEEILDQCTELGRMVLVLHRVEDLSIRQIARKLGRPAAEVRSAHDDACLTVAAAMRARGWSEATWAAAIA